MMDTSREAVESVAADLDGDKLFDAHENYVQDGGLVAALLRALLAERDAARAMDAELRRRLANLLRESDDGTDATLWDATADVLNYLIDNRALLDAPAP